MVSILSNAAHASEKLMKHWVRILMIMTGIMLALVLVIYTDPKSVREFIRQKYKPARPSLTDLVILEHGIRKG